MSTDMRPRMNKRLLSILLSASLLASSVCFAVPVPVTSFDTALETIPEIDNNTDNTLTEEAAKGGVPVAVISFDTAIEQNTEFGTPDLIDTATLSADALQGLGTEESPYLITSKDELKLFASNINNGINTDAYYTLTTDIDLGGAEWTPIGYLASSNDYSKTFGGVFDGAGFTVSNFKITSSSTNYIGFFGYVYEGSVKNLNIDNAVINVSSTSTQKFYSGILAGRMVTVNGAGGGRAEIYNCNITNSSLTSHSKGELYAGGLVGCSIAGPFTAENQSSIIISMCDVDCDINVSSASQNEVSLAIGGLIGYLSSEKGALMKVLNCNTFGSITSVSTTTSVVLPIVGGMFGVIMAFDDQKVGGDMHISSCHSEGDIIAKSKNAAFAAGFAGQISASVFTSIKDCYSSSNVSGYSGDDTALGGFVGVTVFYNFSSELGNNTIFNCYSTGDVIDETYTAGAKEKSFVGAFVGYTGKFGIYKDCYKLESQRVVGSNISNDDINVLNATQERDKNNYVGFDFDKTWQMDSNADFVYPTLREKIAYVTFISEGETFYDDVFGTDGIIPTPLVSPTKDSTIDKTFAFSHWSLTQEGDAFDFNSPVYENITLHAVFTSSPREYKVNFISGGEKYIEEAVVVYGDRITVPTSIPTKADEGRYYYEFSHWSFSENGSLANPDELTVSGDMTFYAVFTQFDRNMWTGNIASSFPSGYGTPEMPYMIERAEELALMQKVINQKTPGYETAHFALADDINLGGNDWIPIGTSEAVPFSGGFNGNGFRISNYKVADNRYTGFFGYVKNGTIKNVYLSDFDIDITYNLEDTSLYVYVGGVAGYVDSVKFNGEISGVRVSADKFSVSSNSHHTYAGGIIGSGIAHSTGTTTIKDCFVTSPITVIAENGYAYAGGIAARLETTSSSISKIVNCYNIGDISATAKNLTYAGGLVGYLFSHGSSYSGTSKAGASLSESDKDIMIFGSFALANVSSQTESYQYVGYIAGYITAYADVDSVFYTGEKTLTGNKIQSAGVKVPISYLLDKDILSEEMAFDLENTWTYLSGSYQFPILKCMVSDKPGMKIVYAILENGVLDIVAQTNSSNYTVIVAVYSDRNQMMSLERIAADGYVEHNISYDGMEKAAYVKISAVSNQNYKPLFEAVSIEI